MEVVGGGGRQWEAVGGGVVDGWQWKAFKGAGRRWESWEAVDLVGGVERQ